MPDPPEWDEPVGNIDERGIGTTWTPIFCTAPIEPKIVDDFLKREADRKVRADEGDGGFFLVTTAFTPPPTAEARKKLFFEKGIRRTSSPVQPFESPCIGMTIGEIAELWSSLYTEACFTGGTFIVFDERTARDRKSCLLWSDCRDEETARCEFGVVDDFLAGPEAGTFSLTELYDPDEFRDPENPNSGEFYLTAETRDRLFPMSAPGYVPPRYS